MLWDGLFEIQTTHGDKDVLGQRARSAKIQAPRQKQATDQTKMDDDKLLAFCEVTGATIETAQSYLNVKRRREAHA